MTDYAELYKQETGDDIRPLDDLTREWTIITGKYYRWLQQKLSDRDKLLALAEARFRATEKVMTDFDNGDKAYEAWQKSIKAYEEAIGGRK